MDENSAMETQKSKNRHKNRLKSKIDLEFKDKSAINAIQPKIETNLIVFSSWKERNLLYSQLRSMKSRNHSSLNPNDTWTAYELGIICNKRWRWRWFYNCKNPKSTIIRPVEISPVCVGYASRWDKSANRTGCLWPLHSLFSILSIIDSWDWLIIRLITLTFRPIGLKAWYDVDVQLLHVWEISL